MWNYNQTKWIVLCLIKLAFTDLMKLEMNNAKNRNTFSIPGSVINIFLVVEDNMSKRSWSYALWNFNGKPNQWRYQKLTEAV